jgi:HPt (histidine-containing phosphotransfer) domain-containing protein
MVPWTSVCVGVRPRRDRCTVTFPPIAHCAQEAHSAGHLPLINDAALTDLLRALDNDHDAVVQFVSNFVEQWPDRVRRIVERLVARDTPGAVTAVLSVSVSSQMIGATSLTSLSTELEQLVRIDDFAAGLDRIHALRAVGTRTLVELVDRLRQSELVRLGSDLLG